MKLKNVLKAIIIAFPLSLQLQAQTTVKLQDVMLNGNSTDQTLRVTGSFAAPTSGSGLEIAHTLNGDNVYNSYLQSFDRTNKKWLPLNLEASVVRTISRLLVNGSYDDGGTALQVNGQIATQGASAGLNLSSRNGDGRVYQFFTNNSNMYLYDNIGGVRMIVSGDGNVGIGTMRSDSKLAVAGVITAQRMKVTASGWADFVFADDYHLPSLAEIEKYISTHKHLPEIPTESEVNANGADLGEMNKKLLQKVEELTLYLIQQQKEIEALKAWKGSMEKLAQRN